MIGVIFDLRKVREIYSIYGDKENVLVDFVLIRTLIYNLEQVFAPKEKEKYMCTDT